MNKPFMKCGHQANATVMPSGKPSCAICAGIHPGATEEADVQIDLTGRLARCTCGHIRPSSDAYTGALAFFGFRGEGSSDARESCNCGFAAIAHRKRSTRIDHDFEAHGPYEFDEYYCGHAGWD